MSLVNLYLHVWYRYSIKLLTRELETVCSEFHVKIVSLFPSLFVQNSRLLLFVLICTE